ncbi:MAG: hypothetical protein LPK47_12110 [Bacteroidota bacterium]|nr:hypothetical protein [Bacteroidota bacterium]
MKKLKESLKEWLEGDVIPTWMSRVKIEERSMNHLQSELNISFSFHRIRIWENNIEEEIGFEIQRAKHHFGTARKFWTIQEKVYSKKQTNGAPLDSMINELMFAIKKSIIELENERFKSLPINRVN